MKVMRTLSEVDLQYPIGKFERPGHITKEQRRASVAELEQLPENLQAAVSRLHAKELDTPYRLGGWTVRQVVHHVADSHMNSYGRFRLALTEEAPVIKTYDEGAWAELKDARTAAVDVSLLLLRALHSRWTDLLHSLSDQQWAKTFVHPALGEMRLDAAAGLYAWHSRHHVAHIRSLREREGW